MYQGSGRAPSAQKVRSARRDSAPGLTRRSLGRPPYPPKTEEMLASWMRPIEERETLRIFRTFAIHSELAPRTGVLGSGILAHGRMGEREREVMIHRTCALCRAEYEWGVHAAIFGEAVGLRDEQIRSTVRGSWTDPCWPERDGLVFRLADEIHQTSSISEELFAALAEHWRHDQLLELVIIAGWYHAVSYVVNAAGVVPESWAQRFPAAER
jgi:4-carboxymuconolactone decarboxylase